MRYVFDNKDNGVNLFKTVVDYQIQSFYDRDAYSNCKLAVMDVHSAELEHGPKPVQELVKPDFRRGTKSRSGKVYLRPKTSMVKKLIYYHGVEFGGELEKEEIIKMCGVSNTTYHKALMELRSEVKQAG